MLRAAIHKKIPVVAVNDPLIPLDQMLYMFKHDSTHGKFSDQVSIEGDQLVVDSMKITTFNMKDPTLINWGSVGAEYIVEASGFFTSVEKASGHLQQGAGKVIITAPSPDAHMLVMGVNHKEYNPSEDKVVSMASCTMNCLAHLAKIVHEKYGIVVGDMTTIHAVTAIQKVVDSASLKNWRDGRAAWNNLIPANTGAAKGLGKIIPALEHRINGLAFRVPLKDMSVMTLTCQLEKQVDFDYLCMQIKELSEGRLKGILGYTEDLVVSTCFLGDSRSCILDVKASNLLNNHNVTLVAWYDNEFGYANRICDLAMYMTERDWEYRADSRTA